MALKPAANGEYNVRNLKEAKEALQLMRAIAEEVREIYEEHGITQLQDDSTELKKAATRWAVASKTERIDFDSGFHATLVSQSYDPRYVATDEDMPDELPEGRKVIPLQTIIEKKFKSKVSKPGSKAREVWFSITKRVIDREAIDQAVADGVFKVDDVAPAFVEKQKAPYLRIFED